jgi:hypothetical protein
MTPRTIKIGCGFSKSELYIFTLRVITLEEETNFLSRFTEIADTEIAAKKAELEYGILRDTLASFSVEPPMLRKDGKDSPLVEDADNPVDAVQKFFAERTGEKERIANQLVLSFRNQLAPTVVFL